MYISAVNYTINFVFILISCAIFKEKISKISLIRSIIIDAKYAIAEGGIFGGFPVVYGFFRRSLSKIENINLYKYFLYSVLELFFMLGIIFRLFFSFKLVLFYLIYNIISSIIFLEIMRRDLCFKDNNFFKKTDTLDYILNKYKKPYIDILKDLYYSKSAEKKCVDKIVLDISKSDFSAKNTFSSILSIFNNSGEDVDFFIFVGSVFENWSKQKNVKESHSFSNDHFDVLNPFLSIDESDCTTLESKYLNIFKSAAIVGYFRCLSYSKHKLNQLFALKEDVGVSLKSTCNFLFLICDRRMSSITTLSCNLLASVYYVREPILEEIFSNLNPVDKRICIICIELKTTINGMSNSDIFAPILDKLDRYIENYRSNCNDVDLE